MKFEQFRKNRGYSVTEVAKGISVSKATIYSRAKVLFKPRMENVRALASFFNVEISEMLEVFSREI